jgi:hypothetical protein
MSTINKLNDSRRHKINTYVKEYANKTGRDIRGIWIDFYKRFEVLTEKNIYGGIGTIIEQIEYLGLLKQFYFCVREWAGVSDGFPDPEDDIEIIDCLDIGGKMMCPICGDHVISVLEKENNVFSCRGGHSWRIVFRQAETAMIVEAVYYGKRIE